MRKEEQVKIQAYIQDFVKENTVSCSEFRINRNEAAIDALRAYPKLDKIRDILGDWAKYQKTELEALTEISELVCGVKHD